MSEKLDLFEASAIDKQKRMVLAKAQEGGCSCPVCGQFVKVYQRKIYANVARQLIQIYRLGGDERRFVHVKELNDAREFQVSQHWGLVEAKPNEDDPSKRTLGYWRLTERGLDFVLRRTTVEKYVFIKNNRVLGCSKEVVGIDEALGAKFNYEELMKT